MKALQLIASAFFLVAAGQAQASYFQTYCSDAAGTLTRAYGHSAMSFVATERNWTDTGVVETKIDLDALAVEVVLSDDQVLEQESRNTCQPGQPGGVASWRSVSYAKATVTRTDGGLFAEGIVGVSADRKSITGSWICESIGNSMVMCPRD